MNDEPVLSVSTRPVSFEMRSLIVGLATVVIIFTGTSLAVADVDVAACGDVVPAGETGTLTADLDCSATSQDGITLGAKSSLQLAGFEVVGNPAAPLASGVRCDGRCSVIGPGTIRDFSEHGIVSPETATVDNVVLQDHGVNGVDAYSVDMVDSQASGNVEHGVRVRALATIASSTLTGNEYGVTADIRPVPPGGFRYQGSVRMEGSSVVDNVVGIDCLDGAKIVNSTVDGNDVTGVTAPNSISVESSSISNNGAWGLLMHGAHSGGGGKGRVRLESSVVSGNGRTGIQALTTIIGHSGEFKKNRGNVVVKDSTIADNGTVGTESGIWGMKVKVEENSFVTGNAGMGVSAARSKVRESTVNDNGLTGIFADGVGGKKAIVIASDVSGNGQHGISARQRAKVTLSTVNGNGNDAECGQSLACSDIASASLPKLKSTACDTSYVLDTGIPGTDWDVCALD